MKAGNIDEGITVKISRDGTGMYSQELQAKYSDVVFYDCALTNVQIVAMYNATK
jgi:hypothetical protein